MPAGLTHSACPPCQDAIPTGPGDRVSLCGLLDSDTVPPQQQPRCPVCDFYVRVGNCSAGHHISLTSPQP